MGKKNKGNFGKITESIFMSITRKNAKERINNEFRRYIKKVENERGGKLTREETKELRRNFIATRGKKIKLQEAQKARLKATALALVAGLGVGGYALGAHNSQIPGITEGKNKIEVNMDDVEKDVNIENVVQKGKEEENKRGLFVQGLQDSALNEDVEYINELRQETRQEIEKLKTSTQVLNYVKQMYVDRYNSTHEEQIGIENVTLHKNKLDRVFYEDKAQNGDEILRCCTTVEAIQMEIPIDRDDLSEISVEIETENGVRTERVAYHNGRFVTLYDPDEEVLVDKETTLCELGNVVFQGIDTATAKEQMEQGNTSLEVEQKYEGRLIQAVVEYKKARGEPVKESKTQTEQSTQDGFEPGDY